MKKVLSRRKTSTVDKNLVGTFLSGKPEFRTAELLNELYKAYDPQDLGYLPDDRAMGMDPYPDERGATLLGAILKESGKLDELIAKAKKGPVKINAETYQTITAAALLNLVDPEITGKTTKLMLKVIRTEKFNNYYDKVEAMSFEDRQFVFDLRASRQRKPSKKADSKATTKEKEALDAIWDDEEEQQEAEVKHEQKVKTSASVQADKVSQLRQKTVLNVSSILNIDENTAQRLLVYTKWNEDLLMTEFFGENQDAFLQKAGVKMDGSESAPKNKTPDDPNEILCCSICLDDQPRCSGVTMPGCGHWFCTICTTEQIEGNITDGNVNHITCMQQDCGKPVPTSIIEVLVSPKLYAKYSTFISQTYVDQNKSFRWCPSPGCGTVITDYVVEGWARTGVCGTCHYRFCWDCPRKGHGPLECERVKEWEETLANDKSGTLSWLAKTGVDMETLKWLQSNTKECPNCGTSIQKSQGCIHMHCATCQADWCWGCGKMGYGHPGCQLDSDIDKVINQDDAKYEQRKDEKMMFLAKAWTKVEKYNELKTKTEEAIKKPEKDASPVMNEGYQCLSLVYDALQYAAIAWCTHDDYDPHHFEIAEENLQICVNQLKAQMEKPQPSAPDLRHLVSVTTNAVESFLAADFAKVEESGKKKKDLFKQTKDSSSGKTPKEKKPKKTKQNRRRQEPNPLYADRVLWDY